RGLSFLTIQFIAHDADFPRRFDPESDRVALHTEDRDLDVVADLDRFVEFTSENEHGNLHFAGLALIRCSSVSFLVLAGRVWQPARTKQDLCTTCAEAGSPTESKSISLCQHAV